MTKLVFIATGFAMAAMTGCVLTPAQTAAVNTATTDAVTEIATICAAPATIALLQAASIQPNVASSPTSAAGVLLAEAQSACTLDGKVAAAIQPVATSATPTWLATVLTGLSAAAQLAPYVLPLL